MEHAAVAERVVDAVGGPSNIQAAAHCATRLRFVLQDSDEVDQAALDADPDLKGTFEGGGMFQVIVGPGDVDRVFAHLAPLGVKEVSKDELKQVADQRSSWFVRFLKVFADIFVPLIPVLVGGGMLMALNNVLTAEGLMPWYGGQSFIEANPAWEGLVGIINMLAAAPFAFLPILVGFSAAKRFGGNPYLGAAMGMAMVMPQLVNGYDVAQALAENRMTYWDVFGLQVQQSGYQGTVLPILVVAFILANLEKGLNRVLKGTIGFIFTPTLSLLITGFITFVAIGPFLFTAGDALGRGIEWLYTVAGPLGGMVFAFFYSPIVITGLHQSFPPIELQLIAAGGSFIFPIASMANAAQGAACLAVYLTTREKKLKGVAGASSFSAFLGITEPAIFGVNLRLRYPLFIGMGAAAVGGALVALMNIRAVALGAAGYLGFVSIRATDIGRFFIALLITTAISFAVTYAVARRKVGAAQRNAAAAAEGAAVALGAEGDDAERHEGEAGPVLAEDAEDWRLTAPLDGRVLALSEVSDPTFAQQMLGPGAAVDPSDGVLYAPADAVVTVAFPTGHAYGLRTAGGLDVLIHLGFDTVALDGEHFTPLVRKGDVVRRGDVLARFDAAAIRAAGYDLTTPMVVTSGKRIDGTQLTAQAGSVVTHGEEFLSITPKAQPAAAERA